LFVIWATVWAGSVWSAVLLLLCEEAFGCACAFLCSVHAGYITGQNWLIDGGAYPGTF
jgi:hypothetical protein